MGTLRSTDPDKPASGVRLARASAWLFSASEGFPGEPTWEGGLDRIPLGHLFDVVRSLREPGARALVAIRERGGVVGPVLLCTPRNAVEFLVPPGTANTWHLPGTTVAGLGKALMCPLPGRIARGRAWLEQPDGSGTLTDPQVLCDELMRISREPLRQVSGSLRSLDRR